MLSTKKYIVAIGAALTLGMGAVGSAASNPYSDLPVDHWAYHSVTALTGQGILTPYDDGTFRGAKNATRYDMAVIFANLCDYGNLPQTALMQNYTDLSDDAGYKNSVAVVTKCGIMSGYGDKTFRGHRNITRFDLANMLARYMRAAHLVENETPPSKSLFTDLPTDHWAYANVTLVAQKNVMYGYGDETFRGDRPITRYEVAQIIGKMMKL